MPQAQHDRLDDVIADTDVLYVTRVQKERFASEVGVGVEEWKMIFSQSLNPPLQAEYERLKDSYIITPTVMAKAKSKMILMHPLPRVNEIR